MGWRSSRDDGRWKNLEVPVVMRWAESAPLAGRRLTDQPKGGDASGTPGTHGSGIPEQGQQPTSPTGSYPSLHRPAARRAPRTAAMTTRRSLVIPVDVCTPPQLNTASHQFSSNSSDLIATASINVGRCGLWFYSKMASSKNRKILFLALITCLQNACLVDAGAYFADWSALAEDRQPTCVAIPSNMSLCTNIGYNKMRLPNLLEHDTIQEASQQAAYWVPLIQSNCSEHSKLFLCSLFAPVCLDRPIYPCRSLCQKVKAGCEGTMKSRGFPWPPMLDCNKFPLDNDMCITSQAESEQNRKKEEEKKNAKAGSAKSGNKAGEFIVFDGHFYQ